jgi:hypothetical protein
MEGITRSDGMTYETEQAVLLLPAQEGNVQQPNDIANKSVQQLGNPMDSIVLTKEQVF